MGKQSDNKLTEAAAPRLLLSISAYASYLSVVEGDAKKGLVRWYRIRYGTFLISKILE